MRKPAGEMKDFNRQFRDCMEDGVPVVATLPESPFPGRRVLHRKQYMCGRFGGVCEDHNRECLAFRNADTLKG